MYYENDQNAIDWMGNLARILFAMINSSSDPCVYWMPHAFKCLLIKKNYIWRVSNLLQLICVYFYMFIFFLSFPFGESKLMGDII